MRPIPSTPIAVAVLSLFAVGAFAGSDYDINRMSNGGFEVIWPKQGCIASYNAKGQSMHYNEQCNDKTITRSEEIARRNAHGSDHPTSQPKKGTSTEYKRGYNDALKGKAFDQDRHPQAYKDGYRAGENAR